MRIVRFAFTFGLMFVSMMASAAEPTISVTAKQRYPWNGLVDLSFTITGDSGAKYPVDFCARDKSSDVELLIKSVVDENGKKMSLGSMLPPGSYRWVWNAEQDVGIDFCSDRVVISGAVNERTWMVVSLDSGAVAYRAFKPVEGWSSYDAKAVILRRVESGSFYMGSQDSDMERQSNEDYHKVIISKPYYMSIKPISVEQKNCLFGQLSDDANAAKISYIDLRGDDVVSAVTQNYASRTLTISQSKSATKYSWPGETAVAAGSVIGKFRDKFSMSFDLPTEAQWEFARENDEEYGFEGMRGTCGEWCRDAYKPNLGTDEVTDPKGPSVSYELKGDLLGGWAPSGNGSKHCLYFNGKQYKFDGGEGENVYHYAYYNAYGVRRVVKGLNARKACRTSAYNLNTTGVIFTEGVMMKNYNNGAVITKKRASYKNPAYCFRVVVSAE